MTTAVRKAWQRNGHWLLPLVVFAIGDGTDFFAVPAFRRLFESEGWPLPPLTRAVFSVPTAVWLVVWLFLAALAYFAGRRRMVAAQALVLAILACVVLLKVFVLWMPLAGWGYPSVDGAL